ncbi:hypothetical protein KCU93_g3620, partial [Aureobasidium melanogenum]
MSSFLDLPPEIRLTIYKILLQYILAKDTRILYSGNNPLRCWNTPDCIRHSQPFGRIGPQGLIAFRDTATTYPRHIYYAKYNIHLAEIGDLLFLASTCRLLRSELLALAWSNADIHIESPETYNEMRCIFYDRLTSKSCSFIRTLELCIVESEWLPSETRKIVGLIRRRLPQLEHLILDVLMGRGNRRSPLAPGGEALKILPPHINVKLRHHTSTMTNRWSRTKFLPLFSRNLRPKDKSANARLQSLRMEVSLIRQKRRDAQSKNEKEDQVSEALEATAEMRSLMAG